MNEILHRFGDGLREGVAALCGEFLIADAPEKNRWVIPVAADKPINLRQDFRRVARAAMFIQNQHTQAVACIEQFRIRIAVRHPPRIAARFLQFENAVFLQRVRNGNANARKILMICGTLNGYMLAVEKEARVGIERHCANAEGSFGLIEDGVSLLEGGDEGVEVGMIEGPELGVEGNESHGGSKVFGFMRSEDAALGISAVT